MITQKDFADILKSVNQQAAEDAARRQALLKEYGSTRNFLLRNIVDLTTDIRDGDPQCPIPVVQSFYDLSERLFPLEGERETPAGWQAYVQPDRDHQFYRNERRILGILDTTRENIIAAVVYGVAETTPMLRERFPIDGVVGITYAMVDAQYRRCGLGNYMVNELVPQKAHEFLGGMNRGNIIIGAEVNDISQLTLVDAIADIAGALTLPNGRQNFWLTNGLKPLAFNYSQIELRPELGAFDALTYHVSGWQGDSIPVALVSYLVDFHSRLCLNKQLGLSDEDQTVLSRMAIEMRAAINGDLPFIEINASDHVARDNRLIAAINNALASGIDLNTPMVTVIANYQQRTGVGTVPTAAF